MIEEGEMDKIDLIEKIRRATEEFEDAADKSHDEAAYLLDLVMKWSEAKEMVISEEDTGLARAVYEFAEFYWGWPGPPLREEIGRTLWNKVSDHVERILGDRPPSPGTGG